MLEKVCRDPVQRFCVDPVAVKLKGLPISPSHLTLLSCLAGIASGGMIAWGQTGFAFLLLCASGYLDMLDGTWARLAGKTTPFGCALDIVCDRIVEAAVVLGFYGAHLEVSPLIALFMLCSILICVTTFLVVGIFSENSTQKSFHYSVGLMERAEAFIFFGCMLLFPGHFQFLGILFSILVFVTAFIRMFQFFISCPETSIS